MKTIHEFRKIRDGGKPISMVTSYDYWSAKIVAQSTVDCILVGDSAAMVMHGFSSTLQITSEVMALHTAAVCRGAEGKWVVADMPFLSYRKGLKAAMNSVDQLMKAGAQAVKLEGIDGHEDIVRHIVQSGVPVMGHIGLTPQSLHAIGGFKVQGRDEVQAKHLFEQAKRLQDLGSFSLVLECIPAPLAQKITDELSIPTIGIGAGPHTDGQVLVLQDLLGLNQGFKPKFLRNFDQGYERTLSALDRFHQAVQEVSYPKNDEAYLK